MDALRRRHEEILIPKKVAKEINAPGSKLSRFLRRYPNVITELIDNEKTLYLMALQQPGIDEGEAAAIVIALSRSVTLVCEDGPARRYAKNLQIRTTDWQQFQAGQF